MLEGVHCFWAEVAASASGGQVAMAGWEAAAPYPSQTTSGMPVSGAEATRSERAFPGLLAKSSVAPSPVSPALSSPRVKLLSEQQHLCNEGKINLPEGGKLLCKRRQGQPSHRPR